MGDSPAPRSTSRRGAVKSYKALWEVPESLVSALELDSDVAQHDSAVTAARRHLQPEPDAGAEPLQSPTHEPERMRRRRDSTDRTKNRRRDRDSRRKSENRTREAAVAMTGMEGADDDDDEATGEPPPAPESSSAEITLALNGEKYPTSTSASLNPHQPPSRRERHPSAASSATSAARKQKRSSRKSGSALQSGVVSPERDPPTLRAAAAPADTRPLEERPYQDTFPDLDVYRPLRYIRMHPNFGVIDVPEDPPTSIVDGEPAVTGAEGRSTDEMPDDAVTNSSADTKKISPKKTGRNGSPGRKRAEKRKSSRTSEPVPAAGSESTCDTADEAEIMLSGVEPGHLVTAGAPPSSTSAIESHSGVAKLSPEASDAEAQVAGIGRTRDTDDGTMAILSPLSAGDVDDALGASSGSAHLKTERDPELMQAEVPQSCGDQPKQASKLDSQDQSGEDWTVQLFGTERRSPKISQLQEVVPSARVSDPLAGVTIQLALPQLRVEFTKPVPKAVFCEIADFVGAEEDSLLSVDKRHFSRPEKHYVRYVEPTEDQLAERVEYDMDDQDIHWLQTVNEMRREHGEGGVPEAVFEQIMDRLEKEWFDLMKDVPKVVREETGPEDTACAVCDDGECENSNAIVFCDGCNLAVHQDCYGVPYIPEGQWLCRKCMLSPETPVSCLFCPNEGGAFKQTNSNRWAHVMCAQWIPEAHFANPVYMEPIECIENVPESRWKLLCYICKRKKGACIQCSSKNCYSAYHVTCARKVKLFMKMRLNTVASEEISLKSFCDKHSPKEHKELFDVEKEIAQFREAQGASKSELGLADIDVDDDERKKRKRSVIRRQRIIDSDDESNDSPAPELSKAARAHQQHYAPSAPVVNSKIFKSVIASVKTTIGKKNQFMEMVCRYWSLKREARRGAPLLKRLHLEPWTVTASATKEDDSHKAKRNEILRYIRNDLERVRLLSELVKKRERDKLKLYQIQVNYLETIINPITQILRPVLEEITKLDYKGLFLEPVSPTEVPDYYELIMKPMDFSTMKKKLENHEYRNLKSFQDDIFLICENASSYNSPDTPWGRSAPRIKQKAQPILDQARQIIESWPIDPATGSLTIVPSPSIFADFAEEPPVLPATPQLSQEPNSLIHPSTPNSPALQDLAAPVAPEVLAPPGDEELAKALQETEDYGHSLRSRSTPRSSRKNPKVDDEVRNASSLVEVVKAAPPRRDKRRKRSSMAASTEQPAEEIIVPMEITSSTAVALKAPKVQSSERRRSSRTSTSKAEAPEIEIPELPPPEKANGRKKEEAIKDAIFPVGVAVKKSNKRTSKSFAKGLPEEKRPDDEGSPRKRQKQMTEFEEFGALISSSSKLTGAHEADHDGGDQRRSKRLKSSGSSTPAELNMIADSSEPAVIVGVAKKPASRRSSRAVDEVFEDSDQATLSRTQSRRQSTQRSPLKGGMPVRLTRRASRAADVDAEDSELAADKEKDTALSSQPRSRRSSARHVSIIMPYPNTLDSSFFEESELLKVIIKEIEKKAT